MRQWRRVHANGWKAEVWLATDGLYYHRTYESALIPADFAAKIELAIAKRSADARIPRHHATPRLINAIRSPRKF